MKKTDTDKTPKNTISRRNFINTLGATTAGLMFAPYLKSGSILAYDYKEASSFRAQVALTRAANYERQFVRQRMEHLFESLGGLSDVVRPGDKVALKINLVGGSGNAHSPRHQGRHVTETMWTHPEVLRATGELIIDAGVSPDDIYIVEALWDDASYDNYGYREVQNDLGVKFVDIDKKEPYDDFMDIQVGEESEYYESFRCNRILKELDVCISIAKMKQHSCAGVTHTIKNQVGIVPLEFYTLPFDAGRRGHLHTAGGSEGTHLPKAINDLFFAYPIQLAVIDGIMNSMGGEGVWNATFVPADFNVLLAGKDPVATDSVASYLMGDNPEEDRFELPGGGYADNYLKMLSGKGAGTNVMSEIQLVGDGADIITSVDPDRGRNVPDQILLSDNFPNPFNSSTNINFYLPERQDVSIKLYSVTGQHIETIVNGIVPAGHHHIRWNAGNGLASGVYIYVMTAGSFSESKKMVYQK